MRQLMLSSTFHASYRITSEPLSHAKEAVQLTVLVSQHGDLDLELRNAFLDRLQRALRRLEIGRAHV